MKWEKLGLVWAPDGTEDHALTHAMLPTPILLDNGDIRVFVTCLDALGRGRPFWVDVAAADPTQVVDRSPGPLMDLGRGGTFDDNGVVFTSVVRDGDGRLLAYYAGFELGKRVRYRILTGLATSDDEGTMFSRFSETPILERSDSELLFRCGPFVIHESGLFRMWYVAGSDWTTLGERSVPVYRMHYIESADGRRWPHKGVLSLDFDAETEHGIGRPWVFRTPDHYKLIYSVRSRRLENYTLGYAESPDGLDWTRRDDEMRLKPAPGAFDEGGAMYAALLQTNDALWCFYNGDNFGRSGFGVARLEL